MPTGKRKFTDADMFALRHHFMRTPMWRTFLRYHGFRLKWQGVFVFVLVVSLLCWYLSVEYMQHISIALAIEQLIHKVGHMAVNTIEKEA